jgi:hypothetical protein
LVELLDRSASLTPFTFTSSVLEVPFTIACISSVYHWPRFSTVVLLLFVAATSLRRPSLRAVVTYRPAMAASEAVRKRMIVGVPEVGVESRRKPRR